MQISFKRKSAIMLLAAASLAFGAAHNVRAQAGDIVLANNGDTKITMADFDASILRIPEKDRFGWAMSQDRINKEIESLLRTRSIAEEARRKGLDADPVMKTRLALYADRLLAEAAVAKIDAESIKEFETRRAIYVERAREQYLINKDKYRTPSEVRVSHILITTNGRTPDEALSKIKSLREKIAAGASFEEMAVANSEDSSVKVNRGDLGYFGTGQMDPAFETAAFGLKKPGELSEPVKSRFGYHLIRFEDRKEPRAIPFEEALPDLIEKLKAEFLDIKRGQAFKSTFDSSRVQWNEQAVTGLRKRVDPAILKSATQ
jgi:peptidyl-prolyl cis-trans isomerase C